MKAILKQITLLLLLGAPALAREWAAHEVSLRTQVGKIREKEGKIAEIIHEKDKEKDDEKRTHLLTELAKEYKELQKLYKDLDEEKRDVRFKHPDQGLEVERKYQSYKIKSIEDIETEVGTEGKLSRLKMKVIRKYGSSLDEPSTPVEKAPVEAKEHEKSQDETSKRPKLSY